MKFSVPEGMGPGAAFGAGFVVIGVAGLIVVGAGFVLVVSSCAIAVAPANANTAAAARKELRIASLPTDQRGPDETRSLAECSCDAPNRRWAWWPVRRELRRNTATTARNYCLRRSGSVTR